jgi:electron transport complex protein RnfG
MTAPPPGTERPQVKSSRLIATLAIAGMLAGTLIVTVYEKTLPAIEAHRALVLQQAIQTVLSGPERFDTLYVVDEAFIIVSPETTNPNRLERVFVGYRGDAQIGYAIAAGEPGFQDVINLMFGYDHATGQVIGMQVLGSKETPGLGDKIEKDSSFVRAFRGITTPITGMKAGTSDEPGELDMITGATISSRAVIKIINNALLRLTPMIEAYEVSR